MSTGVKYGLVADPSLQVPQNSRGGERSISLKRGTTATSKTKNPTGGAPRNFTRVSSCSSIRPKLAIVSSVCPFQHPGKPCEYGLTIGSRTHVELRGGEDVSHHPVRAYILPIPRYSWSAIFLYVYTGQIKFAAIDSQDIPSEEPQNVLSEVEPKPPQDRDGFDAPPPSAIVVDPCSPKSIYKLANKVCLSSPRSDIVTNTSPRRV